MCYYGKGFLPLGLRRNIRGILNLVVDLRRINLVESFVDRSCNGRIDSLFFGQSLGVNSVDPKPGSLKADSRAQTNAGAHPWDGPTNKITETAVEDSA